MCRHIYWNIVDCDVKRPIHLTQPRIAEVMIMKSKKIVKIYIALLHRYTQQKKKRTTSTFINSFKSNERKSLQISYKLH